MKKTRKYRYRLAGLYLLLSFLILSIPAFAAFSGYTDLPILIISLSFTFFLLFAALRQIMLHNKEHGNSIPIKVQSVKHQIKNLKIIFVISLFSFTALSIMTIIDLNRLESFSVEHVEVWIPVAVIYKLFGYWPTIFFVPVVGVLISFCLIRIMFSLRSQSESKIPDQNL